MAERPVKGVPQNVFYQGCAATPCDRLERYIKRHRDRTKREGRYKYDVQRRRIGGLATVKLQPFVARGGMPLRFSRCFQRQYVDRDSHDDVKETCTKVADYRVEQGTLDCFADTVKLLETLRPVKRGRPARKEREKVADEVLALVGCSSRIIRENGVKRIEQKPLTPSIAAAVTGYDIRATKGAFNNLVYANKIVGISRAKGEKMKGLLTVLQEKGYEMPKDYAITFDDFKKSVEGKRRAEASKKLFSAVSPIDIPKAPTRAYPRRGRGVILVERVKKGEERPRVSTAGRRRARAEEEAWRRRMGYRKFQPRYFALGTEML